MRLLPWVLSAVLLASAAHAAEPSEADRATARNLAREGYDALQKKDYERAEDRFRRADALVHAPTIVVDHARALTGLGRFVEACERYNLVIREGVPANAPWPWKQAVADATKELAAIEPRRAWLKVTVKGASKPQVLVDTDEVPSASLGVPRATDPGQRRVRVSANGFRPSEQLVELAEGEKREVVVELDPLPIEDVTLEEDAPEPPPTQTIVVTKQDDTLMYVAFGVGGAGIIVGSVTGFLALSARSKVADECPGSGKCKLPPGTFERVVSDRSSYRQLGTISGVSYGVGFAAAAAGAALFLTREPDEPPPRTGFVNVVPYVGLSEIGATGTF
jgi:hypothetical protein